MNKHSIEILEFNKVLSTIRGKCLTPYGAEKVDALKPLFVRKEIRLKQQALSEMKDIINFGTPFPLYRTDECRAFIHKTTVENHFIEPKEILIILQLVSISIELHKYNKDDRDNFPLIANYLTELRAFPELKKEIETAIDPDGAIKDSASKKLRSIRSELSESKRKIVNTLNQFLSKQSKQTGWQDDIVTMRNDRYVIGIPTNNYQADMGILHDRSQTGATFYIEPKETVETNNKINMLYQEERMEIQRILKVITKEIGNRSESLISNADIIGTLDSFHACANFSNQIKGNSPIINEEPSFNFLNVKHPLLMLQFSDQSKVIPNTIALNDNRQAILITGPNTGGKTILLKTVGLSILMAQSGLHISCDEKSECGIFHEIFSDIGDEQSIELSLSTFSSHIKNIIGGLHGANSNTLILFDEIGAGTDPNEGSALAEATILYVIERNARMIVTTHYSQLKTLAMEYPELENGSLEFNRETLTPTYKLQVGIPGSSYAVEIAERLGMPKSICEKAVSLLSSGEKSLDKLITSLEEELNIIKKDKTELAEKLEKATQLEAYYKTLTEHLKKEIDSEKEKALADTSNFLQETRREIEKLVAEIRSTNASEKSVKEFHRILKDRENRVRTQIDQSKKKVVIQDVYFVGDAVEIISLHQKGEIDSLIGKDKAKIKVGNIFTTVEIRNLKKTDSPISTSPRKQSNVSYNNEPPTSREIHLRGMTVDEATEKLDQFLDQAIISGISQVYVIHGKGA
ncbi:MAG TPA: endonuclease MutS2, partial [candidate division Zixibacteria bacterium]|nr:endonuclease MutS2 [candidate division Zixibacteria bacterium]